MSSVHFRCPCPMHPPPQLMTSASHVKTINTGPYIFVTMNTLYRSRKVCWMTCLWLWAKIIAVVVINKKKIVCMINMIKWQSIIQSLWNLRAILHWSCLMFRACLNFGRIPCSVSRILGMVGLIDQKQNWGGSIMIGFWMLGWLHVLNIWPHPWPWPWIVKVRFCNACKLYLRNWKWSQSIGCWSDYVT